MMGLRGACLLLAGAVTMLPLFGKAHDLHVGTVVDVAGTIVAIGSVALGSPRATRSCILASLRQALFLPSLQPERLACARCARLQAASPPRINALRTSQMIDGYRRARQSVTRRAATIRKTSKTDMRRHAKRHARIPRDSPASSSGIHSKRRGIARPRKHVYLRLETDGTATHKAQGT